MLAMLSGPEGSEPVNATLSGGGDAGTGPGAFTIGRLLECEVALPGDPSVSRKHAVLTRVAGGGGAWLVEDLGSRSGTFLNGVRLPAAPSGRTPVRTGDLLRVGGYEFLLTVIGGRAGTGSRGSRGTAGGSGGGRTMATVDDRRTAASRIERLDTSVLSGGVAARRLALLTGAVEVFASAQANGGEDALALEAVRIAVEGSGWGGGKGGRGTLVRPAEGEGGGGLEVIASVGMDAAVGSGGDGGVSRSLVAAAMGGQLAKLSGGANAGTGTMGASIAELGISSALAAPVRVGERVVACLYVDTRGGGGSAGAGEITDEAAGFVDAVAKVLGLSLAEMHRRDLEQRQLVMHAELEAAHQVQQFLLPGVGGGGGVGVVACGGYEVALSVMPGRFVAGDMVEVVALPGDRLAVALGDATGHGIGPAMLIATVQSQLSALLLTGMGAAEVVTRINRYLCARVEGGRFVSLWLGIFSPDGTVEIVDAGHGHALVQEMDGSARALRAAGGVPLGIDEGFVYVLDRTILPPGARVVLYSDGVIEERVEGGSGGPFGVHGLVAALGRGGAAETVAGVTGALRAAAGGDGLSDDATVAVVQRVGGRV